MFKCVQCVGLPDSGGYFLPNGGSRKVKERLLNLVLQEGIHKRFWLAEQGQRDDWYTSRRFLGVWRLVKRLLYVRRAILY